MDKKVIVIISMSLISLIIGLYIYPRMPGQMASHWNIRGEVDDYMSRFWGVFLIPFIHASLMLLLLTLPRIDPLDKNIDRFKGDYHGFLIVFSIYMLFIYIWTLLWNLGVHMSPNLIMPIGISVLFYHIGVLLEKTRRNWFIGIRTPWTLNSEKIWLKTHKVGGKLFKISGLIAFIGMLFEAYSWIFIIVPIAFSTLYSIAYSYKEYKETIRFT
ncbi:MAG: SdpI family protein [Candidatus Woesearchaeota archaeon]|nr:SdpI family protein [Candidatus Woesearchaeota archaeon]